MKQVLLVGKWMGILGGIIFLFWISFNVRNGDMPQKGVLYNPAVQYIFNERDKAKMRVSMMSIQSVKPESFEPFLKFIQSQGKIKPSQFSPYIIYFKRIAEYYPNVVGGYENLGFCYYYLNKREEAQEVYEKAVQQHSDFFWGYYNLGIIYFQKGEYAKSTQMLHKAIQLNPVTTLKKIYTSRAYGEILKSLPQSNHVLEKSLKSAYQNSYKLIALSEYYQKNTSLQNRGDFLKKNNVDVRLF